VDEDLLRIETSRSHSHTPHSTGFPWASDQSDVETFTWQYTTDRYPCPWWDSNAQSQQASNRRPSP